MVIGIGINIAGVLKVNNEEVVKIEDSLKDTIDSLKEEPTESVEEVKLDKTIDEALGLIKPPQVDSTVSTDSISSPQIENKNMDIKNSIVLMKTNFGDIKIELFNQDTPKTVENFITLSKKGFYNSTRFHRVIKGFMIQGGDPNSKDTDWSNDGQGGPGYAFADEIHANNKNVIGTLSMANSGPNTNGSQFFINTGNNNFLDSKHTVFGRVIDGLDVVKKIENVKTDKAKGDHPIDDVVVKEILVK